MLKLTPFLLFDGDCAQAMRFYHDCFGGELRIVKVSEMPYADQLPPEQRTRVAYAHLKSDLVEFSATDWLHPTRTPRQGNTVAAYLNGTYEGLRRSFDHLSQGADPSLLDALQELSFGIYGHLADRYGAHWFFQGDKSTSVAA